MAPMDTGLFNKRPMSISSLARARSQGHFYIYATT